MISAAQHAAIRAYVLAALNLDLPAGMTALGAEQVVWELQDFPRGPDVWVSLQVVAAIPLAGQPERIVRGSGPTREILYREEWEVTVSVTLRSQRSDATPTWASDAGLRLRRVVLARSSSLQDTLAAAGCPIWRVGGIREFGGVGPRGSQHESTAQVDLELRIMAQVAEQPVWAASVGGEARLTLPGADEPAAVVPFRVPPEET